MKVEILRKITVKDVMKGAPAVRIGDADVSWRDAVSEHGQSADLFAVIGNVRDMAMSKTQFGDFAVFTGQFEARRISDGAVFQSTKIIFPQPTEDIMVNQYTNAKIVRDENGEVKRDDKGQVVTDDNANVDFAVIIGADQHVRGDDKNVRFNCKPIQVTAEQYDPLAAIRERLGTSGGSPELASLFAGSGAAAITDQSGEADKDAAKGDKKNR